MSGCLRAAYPRLSRRCPTANAKSGTTMKATASAICHGLGSLSKPRRKRVKITAKIGARRTTAPTKRNAPRFATRNRALGGSSVPLSPDRHRNPEESKNRDHSEDCKRFTPGRMRAEPKRQQKYNRYEKCEKPGIGCGLTHLPPRSSCQAVQEPHTLTVARRRPPASLPRLAQCYY